jgi:polysaccharide biosynthesis protein PelF
MQDSVDVCLIVEGGYPYQLGGVSSWTDAFVRASPHLKFHVIAISVASQSRTPRFEKPENLAGVTDLILDVCPPGRPEKRADSSDITTAVALIRAILTRTDPTAFASLANLVTRTGLGQKALLDSKPAWTAFENVYRGSVPNGSLVDFFWTWRFLARGLLAIVSLPLPKTQVFHAVATGYCGLVGVYAKQRTGASLVLTEHGIYTNERRAELAVATWLFDSGAGGLSVTDKPQELRDVWLSAFEEFSRITYESADIITTQYRANQEYQRSDGAPESKLKIIPNGIDVDRYARIQKSTAPRPLTVLMIGRVVPIKDIRTFILAVALLRKLIPEVRAIQIGPDNDDPEYARGCRELVRQLSLQSVLEFHARVPDVADYLGRADVLALTSISEAQPIALLEAAATGLPAVATDVGSCREIIDGFHDDPVVGKGGIVVNACSPTDVATALASVLSDHTQRHRMGETMKRRAANYYHKNRVQKLYEDLYASLSRPDHTTSNVGQK